MHKLINYVCNKLDDVERKVGNGEDLSMAEIQYADTLAHLKKNLLKAEEMSGASYARKRDAMGRYSRHYSMDGGMIDELHRLMENTPDEYTRAEFQRFIDKISMM